MSTPDAEYVAGATEGEWPPQDVCQRCGGANVVWFAPNKLWNEAMGSEGGIVCPSCFVRAYEAATGRMRVWRLAPNDGPGSTR